jgi:hypothetical protein
VQEWQKDIGIIIVEGGLNGEKTNYSMFVTPNSVLVAASVEVL